MIGKTLLKKLSDFVFSRTHFRENLLHGLFGQRALRRLNTHAACRLNSVSERLGINGFFKEIKSTEFERSDCGGHIAVSSDEDDGKRQILSLHALQVVKRSLKAQKRSRHFS